MSWVRDFAERERDEQRSCRAADEIAAHHIRVKGALAAFTYDSLWERINRDIAELKREGVVSDCVTEANGPYVEISRRDGSLRTVRVHAVLAGFRIRYAFRNGTVSPWSEWQGNFGFGVDENDNVFIADPDGRPLALEAVSQQILAPLIVRGPIGR